MDKSNTLSDTRREKPRVDWNRLRARYLRVSEKCNNQFAYNARKFLRESRPTIEDSPSITSPHVCYSYIPLPSAYNAVRLVNMSAPSRLVQPPHDK